MGRARTHTPRTAPRSRRAERDPAKPLRQPRQETFAKVYADTLSVQEAVRAAGYRSRSAAAVAGCLLSSEAMQKRIRYLQRNDPESFDTVKLIQSLYLDLRASLAKAVVRNPFTSELSFDMGRLSAQEIAALDVKLLAKDGRLGPSAPFSLQSGAHASLAVLARIVSAPDYTPNRKEKETLSDMLREIAQRNNSMAPIRAQ